MRKTLLILILLLSFNIAIDIDIVYADNVKDDLNNSINATLDKIDLGSLDEFIDDNLGDKALVIGSIKDYILSILNGDRKIGFIDILNSIKDVFFKEILGYVPILILVVSISLLLSIVSNMSANFASHSTNEIIYFACFITIIIVVVGATSHLLYTSINTLRNINSLMSIVFPILITLMASLGGSVTVANFSPLMASLTFISSTIIGKIIIPLFIAGLVFSIVGNLSHNIKLDKMTNAVKTIAETILGIVFSLFMSFVTMEGITGSTIDSVSIKSAKFAISSYVPILGGYLSDGFDIALASGVLIKNTLGYTSIIIMLLFTLSPIIKIVVFILTLKITAGLTEPIADARIASFLDSISRNLSLLIAIILGIAFMFFVMNMMVILTLNVVV